MVGKMVGGWWVWWVKWWVLMYKIDHFLYKNDQYPPFKGFLNGY
jgi:hypothetical protein